MDNMENRMVVGIDDDLEETSLPTMDEVKTARKPYITWEVSGNEYKLHLTASGITKLEQRFNKSLLTAVLDEGIPPVSTMITILQSALQKYHHGIKSYTVEEMFDAYIEAGGTQITLLRELIYPLMADAGFFTDAQINLLTREIADADTNL